MKIYESARRYYKILEYDRPIRDEIIRSGVESIPGKSNYIYDAIIHGNAKEVERHAHSLKGIIGYFNIDEIYNLVYELEKMGREDRLEGAEKVYGKLKILLDDMNEFFSIDGWEENLINSIKESDI
jgi:hypothetical protein